MTPSRKQKLAVEAFVSKWCGLFGLQPYEINYAWQEKPDPEDEETLADVVVSYPYRSAKLSIYPAFWKCDKAEREKTLLHEIVHVLLAPLEKHRLSHERLWTDEEEKVCDTISMVVHGLVS